MHIFELFGQHLLEKSRAYYFPQARDSSIAEEMLSDAAFSALLNEIDSFSEQFHTAPTTSMGPATDKI